MRGTGVLVLAPDGQPRLRLACRLRSEDFPAWLAEDPEEAWRLLALHPCVGVVLADESLRGRAVLARLRARTPRVVRILLTTEEPDGELQRAEAAGDVFRVVRQPCDTTELLATIREAVTQRELITACLRRGGRSALFRREPVIGLPDRDPATSEVGARVDDLVGAADAPGGGR